MHFYKILLHLLDSGTQPENGMADLTFEYFEKTADAAGKARGTWKKTGTHLQPLYLQWPAKLQFSFQDDTGRIREVDRIFIDFTQLRHGISSPLAADVEAAGELGRYRITRRQLQKAEPHRKREKERQKPVEIMIGGVNELVNPRRYYGLRVEMLAKDGGGKPIRLIRDDPEVVVDPQP
jgi:hypothetical protein